MKKLKVKILSSADMSDLEKMINDFISDKKIHDIKFTEIVTEDYIAHMTAYICFYDR